MRIGVFDSGLGGVNVLSCLRKKYPNNDYIYFGDTKNLPYGDKSIDELITLARNGVDFLISKQVDIIVIACGTLSSTCYNKLDEEYNIPIFDIISPTLNYLNKISLSKIGVIGTKRTIQSNIFNISGKDVLMKATPSFVPIIENNLINEKHEEIINELKDFVDVDILVFGCTHYPALKDITSEMNIKTIDMGEILTNEIDLPDEGNGSCELYFSNITVNLIINVNRILGEKFQIYAK